MALALPGSTCVATRATAPTGNAGSASPRSAPGGCDVAEDPTLDARHALPQWLTPAEALLLVRAAHPAGPYPRPAAPGFDLWRVPGRKQLVLGSDELTLTVDLSAQHLQMALASDVVDGIPYASSVPLDAVLRTQADHFRSQALALQGLTADVPATRAVTRAALLHLRALQALDASLAGASHRGLAQALFGWEAVQRRWHSDSELRAQVRHLISRGEGLMRGGYLALAGIEPPPPANHGDKAAH